MDLIFLHGPAASGKLTVARALEADVGYPVFHNHLVVDLLTTVFPFGTEPFVRLREEIWLAVMQDAARAGTSLIFTFAPEATVPAGFAGRVRQSVEAEGGVVRFVQLTVTRSEQERRIANADRKAFHKLSDVETLLRLRDQATPVEIPPADLLIASDTTPPDIAARRIADEFGLLPQRPIERFPDTSG